MALRVQRSALVLAAIVLSGCEGSPFATGGGQGPVTSNPAISQTGTQTVRQRVQQLRSDQAALANAFPSSRASSPRRAARSPARHRLCRLGEHHHVAGLMRTITSRLQSGTTPGNPGVGNSGTRRRPSSMASPWAWARSTRWPPR